MKKRFLAPTPATAITFSAQAQGAVIYLDFENIAPYPNNSDVAINGYYNGGTASNGNSGPNLGVEFTSSALLLCLNTAGTNCSNTSRGGLGIPTSQRGALYFPNANPIMNVAAGFDTGFAGVYSDPFSNGSTVSIYDGLNGTGNLLASITLPNTADGDCDSNIAGGARYCPFNPFSLTFNGIARSVVFGGETNRQVFDDFTFGSNVVGGVPEPTTWALMILGFGLVGGAMRRSRPAVSLTFA
jgi:hypothetical protein